MKKMLITLMITGLILSLFTSVALADKPVQHDANGVETGWEKTAACTSIQAGTLKGSDGVLLTIGFDTWGYNYQAHMFNGGYCDAYHNAAWCLPYKEDELIMKWNDAWIANNDCDRDGLLDRHFGFTTYIGSGAWLTNHMKGEYLGDGGQICKWEYFTKIVAAPADAVKVNGVWYAADGTEIGPVIWNDFATIQSVYNDPCSGLTGLEYLSPDHAGFGGW